MQLVRESRYIWPRPLRPSWLFSPPRLSPLSIARSHSCRGRSLHSLALSRTFRGFTHDQCLTSLPCRNLFQIKRRVHIGVLPAIFFVNNSPFGKGVGV